MPVIETVPLLSDNYAFVIEHEGKAVVVDPSEAGPIASLLKRKNLTLAAILLTHHHSDHIGGAAELSRLFSCTVAGPAGCRMPGTSETVRDGDARGFAGIDIAVIGTPGHTRTHVAYHVARLGAVFTGDTLFAAGCGRLFEGSAQDMWKSLLRLAALGDETLVYCGHEYTEDNLAFALSVEPGNSAVQERFTKVKELRRKGQATVPSSIRLEKQTNPFLRACDPAIKKALGMTSATDVEAFAELRSRKDRF